VTTVPVVEGAGSLRGRLVVAVTTLVSRLPEAPLVALAEAAGEVYYRLAPARAAQARANLRRACEGLAASGRGTALARRAATDPDALELIVRRAFRHLVRYYLEVARVGALDLADAIDRIDIEDPEIVREALVPGHPVVVVGMHYGAIELPTVILADLVGHSVTAPMELMSDPGLRRWFVETRERVGAHVVPIVDARRTLLRALRNGESVGMVADRDLLHNGLPTPFFGHPAPIPAGPALLAIEAGVPICVASVRRIANRRYRARLVVIRPPETGTRRERMTALTDAMAVEFEEIIARGPEQWWGSFHPIWPDLAIGGATSEAQAALETPEGAA
jgi:lauroyl/myristoyl acyltransferase